MHFGQLEGLFTIHTQIRDHDYRVIPGHRNWQIETAAWNLAGFLHCASETRCQRLGQFLHDFLNDFFMKILIFSRKILIFFVKMLDVLYEKS